MQQQADLSFFVSIAQKVDKQKLYHQTHKENFTQTFCKPSKNAFIDTYGLEQ